MHCSLYEQSMTENAASATNNVAPALPSPTQTLTGAELIAALATLITEGRISDRHNAKNATANKGAYSSGYSEGPHCYKSKRSANHLCDSSDFLCQNHETLRSYVMDLWKKSIPLCIEVLLFPNCECCQNFTNHIDVGANGTDRLPPVLAELIANSEMSESGAVETLNERDKRFEPVLLEKWSLNLHQRRCKQSVPSISSLQLINALRSQLHFSQLSSWLSLRHQQRSGNTADERDHPKTAAFSNPINVMYRVTVPGLTYYSSPCADLSTKHTFPVTNVIDSQTLITIEMKSLPRLDSIPVVLCPKCHCDSTISEPNESPTPIENFASMTLKYVDDRLPFLCNRQGKHKCTYDDDDDDRRESADVAETKLKRFTNPCEPKHVDASHSSDPCHSKSTNSCECDTENSTKMVKAGSGNTDAFNSVPSTSKFGNKRPISTATSTEGHTNHKTNTDDLNLSKSDILLSAIMRSSRNVDDERDMEHSCVATNSTNGQISPNQSHFSNNNASPEQSVRLVDGGNKTDRFYNFNRKRQKYDALNVSHVSNVPNQREADVGCDCNGSKGAISNGDRICDHIAPDGPQTTASSDAGQCDMNKCDILFATERISSDNYANGNSGVGKMNDSDPIEIDESFLKPLNKRKNKNDGFADAKKNHCEQYCVKTDGDLLKFADDKIQVSESSSNSNNSLVDQFDSSTVNRDQIIQKQTPQRIHNYPNFQNLSKIVNGSRKQLFKNPQHLDTKRRINFDDYPKSFSKTLKVDDFDKLNINQSDTSADVFESKSDSLSGNDIPSTVEQDNFRRSLDNAASMVFNSRTGLPLMSSPAPIRKQSKRFDYDCNINSVSAIRSALFELRPPASPADDDSESDSVSPCSPDVLLSNYSPTSISERTAYKLHKSYRTSSGLLGSFEESVLKGRLEPVSTVEGFTAQLGASGSFCPSLKTFPVTVFFYTLGDTVSSPYLGHVNLGKKGYNVPRSGTLQLTLFNPHGSIVKMFVVVYDLTDMPPNSQTFIRQRTLHLPSSKIGEMKAVENNNLSLIWGQKYLRFLIHLRFMSSKSGKVYLHTDLRMIVFNKSDMDTASGHVDPGFETRSFTYIPDNPKYSTYSK